MNCDQFFDALTQSPFCTAGGGSANRGSERRTDSEHLVSERLVSEHLVSEHLASCPACRRLAERLQPALKVFEAAAHRESSASGATSAALKSGPAQDATCTPASPADRRWQPGWRAGLAALVVVGVVGAFSLFGPGRAGRLGMSAGLPADRTRLVESLGLAAACLTAPQRPVTAPVQHPSATLLAQAESAGVQCCTLCHAAGRTLAVPAGATLRIAQSCQLCHAN